MDVIRSLLTLAMVAAVTACGSAEAPVVAATRAPELGRDGSGVVTELLGPDHALKRPRDLAFNPLRPEELWVVNETDGSVVILHGTLSGPSVERRRDAGALHFMHKPSALAFGGDATSFGSVGTFGTCGESRNEHGGTSAGDFMGPALWSSDLAIFALKNPAGLGSHLDMLHNSPLCMGIAHETANVYWTSNGLTGGIQRYDFAVDHDVGMDDHADGASLEYVRGTLKYVEGVPGHMVYRAADASLYVADTGNGRIGRLDTKSGVRGTKLATKEPQRGGHYLMDGATFTDVVTGLDAPSGLELRNDMLYVSENGTGKIHAYTLDGKRVNTLDTKLGKGALAGLTFGPDGKLYFVDMVGNRVFRVDAP